MDQESNGPLLSIRLTTQYFSGDCAAMSGDQLHTFKSPDPRISSVQSRLNSVRSRVLLAFTYCGLVRTELEYEQMDEARRLLGAIEETISSVRRNLANAIDLPSSFVEEMNAEVDRLEREFACVKREPMLYG